MRFSLEHVSGVLKIRNAAGQPFILIGGQAVNYWATRYLEQEPDLKSWQPFTSKDIDFQGNLEDVLRTASLLGRPTRLPHKKMMTAFVGGVSWPIGGGRSPHSKAPKLRRSAMFIATTTNAAPSSSGAA